MTGLVIHVVTYLAVSGFLTVLWALTTGSFESVDRIVSNLVQDPGLMRERGFWPIWVWLAWGVAVVIHAAVVLANGLFGRRRRRRKQALKEARRSARTASVPEPQRVLDARPRARRGQQVPTPARKWVTVMFTDIAGSTQINETLGDDEWSRLLGGHRTAVRRSLAARGGVEVGTQGDGFLARFPTPAEAVLCGVDIQREIDEMPEPALLRIRIGIHAGEAVEDDGDLVGRVVNVAARVAAEAQPGEILVTEPVADYIGVNLEVEDRGIHALKGLSQPRHLLAVVWSHDQTTAPG